jgi:hypothetical protein
MRATISTGEQCATSPRLSCRSHNLTHTINGIQRNQKATHTLHVSTPRPWRPAFSHGKELMSNTNSIDSYGRLMIALKCSKESARYGRSRGTTSWV